MWDRIFPWCVIKISTWNYHQILGRSYQGLAKVSKTFNKTFLKYGRWNLRKCLVTCGKWRRDALFFPAWHFLALDVSFCITQRLIKVWSWNLFQILETCHFTYKFSRALIKGIRKYETLKLGEFLPTRYKSSPVYYTVRTVFIIFGSL